MNEAELLIIGANGQLGRALHAQYPGARTVDIRELDISDQEAVNNFDWAGIKIIFNAAAYTNVDGAETAEGRVSAWKANAVAPKNLTEVCIKNDMTLLHISTEYVFDGTKNPHFEDEPFSPLGVYAQTKAAADIVVSVLPKYYIIRTSWVIGDGKNFVRTILGLGQKGVNPNVIADDIGRPTFTSELVRAIDHLLTSHVPYGTYNISNEGAPASWADITRATFQTAGLKLTVTETTNAAYYADKPGSAPRPHNSLFDLSKLHATGFISRNWQDDLNEYVKKEPIL